MITDNFGGLLNMRLFRNLFIDLKTFLHSFNFYFTLTKN